MKEATEGFTTYMDLWKKGNENVNTQVKKIGDGATVIKGKVVALDVFKKTYSVDLKDKGIVEFSKEEE